MKYTPDDFPGPIAVISGAARGIGLAVATQLAEIGLTVAALDLPSRELRALAQSRFTSGGSIVPCPTDLRQSSAVAQTVGHIEADLGPIALLAHAAGILRTGTASQVSAADWQACFAVNTHGTFELAQAIAPRMMARRCGALVLVGSNAAAVPRRGMAAYAASKAAAQHYWRCLALEAAPFGVRGNIVAPGSTDTAMQRQLWTGEDSRQQVIAGDLADYRTGIPLQRIATPDDIAQAVVFMLSSASRHMVLHTLSVDGGATLGV